MGPVAEHRTRGDIRTVVEAHGALIVMGAVILFIDTIIFILFSRLHLEVFRLTSDSVLRDHSSSAWGTI